MNASSQSILSLALVAVAVAFLGWRALRRRRSGCATGDCGCRTKLDKPLTQTPPRGPVR